MPKYHVQEPLRHDGDDFEVGSTIDLSAKSAVDLLASGVLIDEATFKQRLAEQEQADQGQES